MKVIAVTAARSEYDLLFSVYEKLNEDPKFDFSLIVAGAHLSPTFGLSVKEIEKDGFNISDHCFNLLDSGEKLARVASIGNQMPLLAQSFYREKPDLVIVAGDREDAISVCLTAAYMSIPVAHFFGGDIAKDGNIDNSVRYASSKFAHIHFPTITEHADTLERLGEDSWRIHVIGNPALDRLLSTEEMTKADLFSSMGGGICENTKFGVVIQHPIISEIDLQGKQMRTTMEALIGTELIYFVNCPNSDAGNTEIRQVIDYYGSEYPDKFYTFKNLNRVIYINLLRHCSVMVGNSSSGLLEAPSLGLPVVNVGSRQRGRVCGENVLFVKNNKNHIKSAVEKCLNDNEFNLRVKSGINPYGDGKSAERVIEILRNLKIDDQLIYKDIAY